MSCPAKVLREQKKDAPSALDLEGKAGLPGLPGAGSRHQVALATAKREEEGLIRCHLRQQKVASSEISCSHWSFLIYKAKPL